jgi:gas vesicle protein
MEQSGGAITIRATETSMKDTNSGDRIAFLLVGSALGAAVALLIAPESGARTRRIVRRKGQAAADYVVDAGQELVERCEDLYKRSGELVNDAGHQLSEKYRALYERSKELVDEATVVVGRASEAARDGFR